MKKLALLFLTVSTFLTASFSLHGELPHFLKNDIVTFTPPQGWKIAPDISAQFPQVKVMVVGSSKEAYPPNMNLSMEPYTGTLKDYLKRIKQYEEAQGNEWKDLGSIRTEAGSGSLSQVDCKSKWGNTRFMRLILIKNANVYILTASALAGEFSLYYKDFFTAMRSFRIIKDPYEMIQSAKSKEELKKAAQALFLDWVKILETEKEGENQEALFESNRFQQTTWQPFTKMVEKNYGYLGSDWNALFLDNVKEELFAKMMDKHSKNKSEE